MQVSELNSMIQEETGYLMPFAINLTGNEEDAKDLIQETIYRALSNSEKYVSGTNLKAWMFTIMRNIFINNYRKKMRELAVVEKVPHEQLLYRFESSSDCLQEMKITIKEIAEFIHHLPELIRLPFMLYCDGFKYREIAFVLREPIGTIKSRIHFARKTLQTRIAGNV
jgi:RNA polymerase sigma-70 factor (ECF subfamily)